MKRRKFIQSATLSASAILLGPMLGCNPEKSKEMKLQITKDAGYQMDFIRGNVGFFSERGGTIGFYADGENTIVIDSQFPDNAAHLIGELHKINKDNFKALINTHHHGDHTAGNISFKGIVDDVIAHENSKKNQMAAGKDNQLYPETTFATDHNLSVGNEKVNLSYYGAAHTDGDCIVHFQNANVAHIGDLVFNRKHPYVDYQHGANVGNWIKVLEGIQKDFDNETIFIFGHANTGYDIKSGKEDLKAFQSYLENLYLIGEKAAKSGMDLETFIAEYESIPNASEWKGEGIERGLKAIHQELSL